MHPGVFAGLVFFSAAAADAQTVVIPDNKSLPGIRLPSSDEFAGRFAPAPRSTDAPFLAAETAAIHYVPSSREFGIGPLRANAFESGSNGRRPSMKPGFRLEGVRVFGGAVSGSVDGRGGLLTLHWDGGN
jgi:hypothetical protein